MPREVYLSASGIPTTGDQSSAVAQWAYTNRGSILVIDPPPGQMYTFGGIVLDSNYSGTRVRWEGYSQLPSNIASPGVTTPTNFGGCWVGVVVGQADEVVLENVMYHGNRANMADNEHVICIGVAGATNLRIASGWRIKEVRGDAIYIGQSDWQNNSANPQYIDIGDGAAMNSVDDGRNAISIVSCSTGTIGRVRSVGVGGVVGGVLQPGGLDIEPDFGYQTVYDVHVDSLDVTTAGTSGLAILGKSASGNDANLDWNCSQIVIGDAHILRTGTSGSGLAGSGFTRCADVKVIKGFYQFNSTPGVGPVHDYSQRVEADWTVNNVTNGGWLAPGGMIYQGEFKFTVNSFTQSGLLVTGLQQTRVRGRMFGSIAANTTYGIHATNNGRSITQQDVAYEIDAPYDNVMANAFYNDTTNPVTFGVGCVARDSDWSGYPSYAATCNSLIPLQDVIGMTWAASIPTNGTWHWNTFVRNSHPAVSAGKATIGWARLNSGSNNVNGNDWTPCVCTNA